MSNIEKLSMIEIYSLKLCDFSNYKKSRPKFDFEFFKYIFLLCAMGFAFGFGLSWFNHELSPIIIGVILMLSSAVTFVVFLSKELTIHRKELEKYKINKEKMFYELNEIKNQVGDNEINNFSELQSNLGFKYKNGLLLSVPNQEKITVPEGVLIVNKKSFLRNLGVREIILPKSLIRVDKNTFSDLKFLTTIIFSGENCEICDYSFYGCESLTKVQLPHKLDALGNWSFAWCELLEKIDLPISVKILGEGTFLRCSKLKKITIPPQLDELQESVFMSCSSLEQINIPNGITLIGRQAFESCSSLETIIIPKSVKMIEDRVFANCSSLKKVGVYLSTLISKNLYSGLFCCSNRIITLTILSYPIREEEMVIFFDDLVKKDKNRIAHIEFTTGWIELSTKIKLLEKIDSLLSVADKYEKITMGPNRCCVWDNYNGKKGVCHIIENFNKQFVNNFDEGIKQIVDKFISEATQNKMYEPENNDGTNRLESKRRTNMGFYLKLSGVTFGDRQRTISKLKENEQLFLVREPNNPHDRNAIAVVTSQGSQVGYIPAANNSAIAYKMDRGTKYSVKVSQVTGGGIGYSYGVNIYIEEE